MISSSSPEYEYDGILTRDVESGYASGSSSEVSMPDLYFTKPHLKFLNQQLHGLEPEGILKWCLMTLPALHQTTAFGLTGLVTLDMLSRLTEPSRRIDLIFLDTLHHFEETLSLVEQVKRRYPNVTLHVYKPQGCDTTAGFSSKYGERLWETDEQMYDWVAKVEPARRAYSELQVQAVLTGRRKSQGGKRGDMDIIEIDETGLIKVNPLANWSFQQVQDYIKEHDVPYNQLLDRGYKSIGDYHSTQYVYLSDPTSKASCSLTDFLTSRPIKEGEDERAGRWKGQEKTECGIHNPNSAYARFLQEDEAAKASAVAVASA
ncbi:MAG: hypothetical protein M1825_006030 [Sarcosagium campestre]|nr:MAG: hypothetical protein M1825_006030 [Sarcosagium campestre]